MSIALPKFQNTENQSVNFICQTQLVPFWENMSLIKKKNILIHDKRVIFHVVIPSTLKRK